jgi:Bacterial Ig-like domain
MGTQRGRFLRVGYTLIVLAIPMCVVSCGQTTISSSGQTSDTSAQTTPTQTQAGATMTPGSNPSPATAGVTLTLNQQHYSADSLIIVTIHNGSQQTIWAADHQTSCTVLTLERQSQGSWYRVGQCALSTPTRVVSIGPGASLTQRLTSQQEMDTGAGWQTGTYRVTLTFHLGNDSSSLAGGDTVHSAQFTIA